MNDDTFVRYVREHSDVETNSEALAVAEATLETLGESLTRGEADDIATHLSAGLADAVVRDADGEAEAVDATEFVNRVREREGDDTAVDTSGAESHVAATLSALRDAMPAAEWNDATDQLPDGYERLLES